MILKIAIALLTLGALSCVHDQKRKPSFAKCSAIRNEEAACDPKKQRRFFGECTISDGIESKPVNNCIVEDIICEEDENGALSTESRTMLVSYESVDCSTKE
ncbi:MAG: hypothetical protein AB7O96_15780 [Pseudobdellovibrionaceae bacterium]